jgi:hypothetical protein
MYNFRFEAACVLMEFPPKEQLLQRLIKKANIAKSNLQKVEEELLNVENRIKECHGNKDINLGLVNKIISNDKLINKHLKNDEILYVRLIQSENNLVLYKSEMKELETKLFELAKILDQNPKVLIASLGNAGLFYDKIKSEREKFKNTKVSIAECRRLIEREEQNSTAIRKQLKLPIFSDLLYFLNRYEK